VTRAGALFLLLAVRAATAQTWELKPTPVKASLRGVSAVSAQVVWASGTGGTWLITTDGGGHWETGRVAGAEDLDFRGICGFDDQHAVMMSSGPGEQSRLYSTSDRGAHWKLALRNPDSAGFFDAVAFRDRNHGFLFGDPVAGHVALFASDDGGESWRRMNGPPAGEVEGAFAASNSVLSVIDGMIRIATGGRSGGRVLSSADNGTTWAPAQTPVRHDSDSAGVFSFAFDGAGLGIAVGGDYRKEKEDQESAAVSAGRGDWKAGGSPHGYRSAVVWSPHERLWVAVGPSGSDLSQDGGRSWSLFASGPFHALSVSADGAVWAAGPQGRAAVLVP